MSEIIEFLLRLQVNLLRYYFENRYLIILRVVLELVVTSNSQHLQAQVCP